MSFFHEFLGGGFPGMGGMGGMGGGMGGMGGMHDEEEEAFDNETYYNRLGISKDAGENALKTAYKKKAREYHPDRHRSKTPEQQQEFQRLFTEMQEAYEVLKDPRKRQIYDQYGEKGLKGGGGGGGGGDIFDMFFGGGRGRGRPDTSIPKSPQIQEIIDVTLEDFYRGSMLKRKITRMEAGKTTRECTRCRGAGRITVQSRMGPMIVQQQKQCHDCGGVGFKMKETEVEIDVSIPSGGRHGGKVTVRGGGHRFPKHEPGDVIFVMRMEEHEIFNRQGADLGMKQVLSLREALCGYSLKIKHVSGTNLLISSKEGEIVKPGQLKRVTTWGMPQQGNPRLKGHLYISFEVQLPLSNTLPAETIEAFRRLLPAEDGEMEVDSKSSSQTNGSGGGSGSGNSGGSNSNSGGGGGGRRRGKRGKGKNKGKNNRNRRRSSQASSDKTEQKAAAAAAAAAAPAAPRDEEEEDEADYEEEVACEDVEGEPRVTPAKAKGGSAYEEDEDEEGGGGCRQM